MTMEILFHSIAGNVFEMIATMITLLVSYYIIPMMKDNLVPWLKEKRIYETIKKLVIAVEKMAETHAIEKVDKKATVIKLLQGKGIEVTEEIEALIEAAVKELDMLVDATINEVKKEH